jgi:pyruvate dehydrogenase E2 component (dihydrolipoamide acetyltransferase)
MHEFKMPSLGADMQAGALMAWKKHPGDRVERGDLIAEVETDKGIIEVESFTTGVIERFLVDVGQKVPVGTVLALIREDVPAAAEPAAAASPFEFPSTAAEPIGRRMPPAREQTERPAMAPSARRLARELGVDPATITGTGHGGAITR